MYEFSPFEQPPFVPIYQRARNWLFKRVSGKRPPDVTIGSFDDPYLLRWFVIPRNRFFNIYLHRFCRSDDDRALHSHPWLFNSSWLLFGSYFEVLPEDSEHPELAVRAVVRREGAFKFRWGGSPHRVLLRTGGDGKPLPVWTLFVTGPRVREWGFFCPSGFKHWKDFTGFRKQGHGNEIGPGCGD